MHLQHVMRWAVNSLVSVPWTNHWKAADSEKCSISNTQYQQTHTVPSLRFQVTVMCLHWELSAPDTHVCAEILWGREGLRKTAAGHQKTDVEKYNGCLILELKIFKLVIIYWNPSDNCWWNIQVPWVSEKYKISKFLSCFYCRGSVAP